ncbi:MAG: glycosyltransferase family 39 protein [Chloroflexota bacterium]|nr:glycosyltransferase family 39 protein [Chloroflexota bacterium]
MRTQANTVFAAPTRGQWIAALVLCVAVVIAALPTLTYPLGRDQGEFATIARGLLDGKVPYVDLWNPKPPAVFVVYAAAIAAFGRTSEAIRAIDLIIIAPTVLALWWIGQRIMGQFGGLAAAALFALLYFTETFWTLTQNDGVVLLPMTLALVCLFKANDAGRRSWIWALLCGALCGVVVWFKYPFALFIGVVGIGDLVLSAKNTKEPEFWIGSKPFTSPPNPLSTLWRGGAGQVTAGLKAPSPCNGEGVGGEVKLPKTQVKEEQAQLFFTHSSRSWLPVRPLCFLFGFVLVLAFGALRLMALGAWDAFIESARVTAGYTALTLNLADIGAALRTALGYRWAHWGLGFVLAAVGAARLWRNRDADYPRWTLVLTWLLAGIGIMLVQGKAYDYHWLPMLPALALLAGFGIVNLIPPARVPATRPYSPTHAGGKNAERSRAPAPAHEVERGQGDEVGYTPKIRGNVEESDLDRDGNPVLKYRYQRWAKRTSALPLQLVQGARIRWIFIGGLIAILGGVLYARTLPYLFGAEHSLTYFSRFQGGEFVADESARVVKFLRERVVTGDSLFIWGFRPEVYYLSGLNPAVRFIFQYPLVADWYPVEWRQQTVDILWAALPPYVLVLQVDYLPWVTGSHDDSNTLLQQYAALNDWLIYNYAPEAQIGNFLIWRRTS